jgi:transposase
VRCALSNTLEDAANGLPEIARRTLASLLQQLRALDEQVACCHLQIREIADEDRGIGPQTATAPVAAMGVAHCYDRGHNFAASL